MQDSNYYFKRWLIGVTAMTIAMILWVVISIRFMFWLGKFMELQ